MTDYYKILGTEKTASDNEIKSAFRKKAMEYHPDRNNGDKESERKFKEINEAYEVLGDPEKRKKYDTPASSGEPFARTASYQDVGSIFDELFAGFGFGNSRQRTRSQEYAKQDFHAKLAIGINEVYCGTKKRFEYVAVRACNNCIDDRKKYACKSCSGRGSISRPVGLMAIETRACSVCMGRGYTSHIACTNCNSSGFKNEKQTIEVNIAKGSTNDIRVSGKGHEGIDGIGDLIAHIFIIESNGFSQGSEKGQIVYDLSISVLDLVVGKKQTVEMPDNNKIIINIPPGTQPGDVIRVKGEGLLRTNVDRGDLYVRLKPFVPKLKKSLCDTIQQAIETEKP